MQTFQPQPQVKIVRSFPSPLESVITSARTCYSSKGIIEHASLNEKAFALMTDLYRAGHHTTFQHAYFQFAITNISRLCVWSFLHSHPFYNSEQVSQRYVEVKEANVLIPPVSGKARNIYLDTIRMMMKAYHTLSQTLLPIVEAEYFRIFPGRKYRASAYMNAIKKKALEVARYVLPLSTLTYLYHTVSALTVFRYWKVCRDYDVPTEQEIIARKMVDALLKIEPGYKILLDEPYSKEDLNLIYNHLSLIKPDIDKKRILERFDQTLGDAQSKLLWWSPQDESDILPVLETLLARSINPEKGFDILLNPASSRALSGSLNVMMHTKLPRILQHVVYTFQKKLSHTADSQNQRHRTIVGSRPLIFKHWTDEPDYIIPALIASDAKALRIYTETMDTIFEQIKKFLQTSGNPEYASYLLPNAFPVRMVETGNLAYLRHKFAMRLCYNAQEEIWRISLQEWNEIRKIHPTLAHYLGPPCALRKMAELRPICPEGKRFCGIRVWELSPEEYTRLI